MQQQQTQQQQALVPVRVTHRLAYSTGSIVLIAGILGFLGWSWLGLLIALAIAKWVVWEHAQAFHSFFATTVPDLRDGTREMVEAVQQIRGKTPRVVTGTAQALPDPNDDEEEDDYDPLACVNLPPDAHTYQSGYQARYPLSRHHKALVHPAPQTVCLPPDPDPTPVMATGPQDVPRAMQFSQVLAAPIPATKQKSGGVSPLVVSRVRASDPSREILLADNLGVDVNVPLEAGVVVVGMKGSGKSHVAARIMEQYGRFPFAQVAFDIKGDFLSLLNSRYWPSGVLMTRSGQTYTPEQILSCELQVVVDLRTWLSSEERVSLIAEMTQGLLTYAMTIPVEDRVSWFVHIDEAQQWVPEKTAPSGVDPRTWNAAKQGITNLGVLGRTYGAVPCVYTQRLATVDTNVTAQGELRVFMKAAQDNDLERYEEYISKKAFPREEFQAFQAGDAVVLLPTGEQIRTRFRPRETPHGSPTPHLTQALAVQQRKVQAMQRQTVQAVVQPLQPMGVQASLFSSSPLEEEERPPVDIPEMAVDPTVLLQYIATWQKASKEDQSQRGMERQLKLPWNQIRDLHKEAVRLGIIPGVSPQN